MDGFAFGLIPSQGFGVIWYIPVCIVKPLPNIKTKCKIILHNQNCSIALKTLSML